eukprot:7373418-Lingulodinium_polyedra.AAC.1
MATSRGTTPVRARPGLIGARSPTMSRVFDATTRVPSQQGHCHSRCSTDSGAALLWGQVPPPSF